MKARVLYMVCVFILLSLFLGLIVPGKVYAECEVACCKDSDCGGNCCKYDNPDGTCGEIGWWECENGGEWNANCHCHTGSSGSCTSCSDCACVAPSGGFQWVYPNANSKIDNKFSIQWSSVSSWGVDSGKKADGDCSGCPSSQTCAAATKFYRVFVDGNNISYQCAESGGADKLIFPAGHSQKCTLTNVNSWRGQSKTFVVKAFNGCCNSNGTCPTISRSFAINRLPEVVSITPNSGWSGTETDSDNAFSCNDKNPQTFTVRYKDPDGIDDLAQIGFWADDTEPPELNISSSAHAFVIKGAIIKIYVKSTPFAGYGPDMDLYIDNVRVQRFYNISTSENILVYRSPVKVRAQDIKLVFINDDNDGNSPPILDRNLYINKIKINGKIYEAEQANVSSCWSGNPGWATLCCQNNYVQFVGSEYIGNDGRAFYGVSYDANSNLDADETRTGVKSPLNYDWDVPNYNGLTLESIEPGNPDFPDDGVLGEQTSKEEVLAVTKPPITLPTKPIYSARPNKYFDSTSTTQSQGALASVRWAGIRNVNSTELEIDISTSFYGTQSDNIGNSNGLNLYGVALDYQGKWTGSGWQDKGDRRLDYTSPSGALGETDKVDQNRFRVPWNGLKDNQSGLRSASVYGGFWYDGALVGGTGYLDKSTSKVLGNKDFKKLWDTTASSGSKLINISNVAQGGDFRFKMKVSDNVCNTAEVGGNLADDPAITVGSPWLITKGGLVYSSSLIDIPVQSFSGTANLYSDWDNRFSIGKDETQISTELLSSQGNITKVLSGKTLSPFISTPYNDVNKSYTFMKLKELYENMPENDFDKVYSSKSTMSTLESVGCTDPKKPCVIEYAGDLTIVSKLTCDRKALIIVNGRLSIDNEIDRGDKINGCIFLVRGNVIFNPLSSNNFEYETYEAFFVAGGGVHFVDDKSSPQPNGVKINGGLVAFGEAPVVSPVRSIRLSRSLRLEDNELYPSIVLHYDPRYVYLAHKFFSFNDQETYIKDTGVKFY